MTQGKAEYIVSTQVMERQAFEVAGQQFLVVIHGPGRGTRRDLDPAGGPVIIGRDPEADVFIDDVSVSRRHCRLQCVGGSWWLTDLGSTNGTEVAGVTAPRSVIVSDGAIIRVGTVALKFMSCANVEAGYFEEIHRMAIFDGLTQIHNRRAFEEFAGRELIRYARHRRPLSLLIFDVDKFKTINDSHGHVVGDSVLRTLATRVDARIRRDEMFARYAGDEFVVVLPETDVDGALILAEDVRRIIDEHRFVFNDLEVPVTVSVGAAQAGPSMSEVAQLVAAADAALYRAKALGRNAVSK